MQCMKMMYMYDDDVYVCIFESYFTETCMIATGLSSLSVSRLSHDPIDVLTWISSGSIWIDLSRVHGVRSSILQTGRFNQVSMKAA